MKHRVSEKEGCEEIAVGVWGPSVACRGLVAERCFWGRADVLVFRGSRAALLAVRVVFAAAPGWFAAGVVRALDLALDPAPESPFLPWF
jgi:hypothetical protein